MERKYILTFAPLLLAVSTSSLAAVPVWTVSEVSGHVRLTENGKSRVASKGAFLSSGSIITTGTASRAVIGRADEFIVISPKSQLRLPAGKINNSIIQIIADFGSALFKVERKTNPHFGVRTPYLAAVVKGTTFRVTADRSGDSVSVVEGAVSVTTRNGGVIKLVEAGMEAAVAAAIPERLSLAADVEGARAGEQEAKLLDDAVAAETVRHRLVESVSFNGLMPVLSVLGSLLALLAVLAGAAISMGLLARAWPSGGPALSAGRLRALFPLKSEKADKVKRLGRVLDRQGNGDVLALAPKRALLDNHDETPPRNVQPTKVAEQSDDDEGLARRQSKRSRVLLSAVVRTPAGDFAVKLRDISRTGAVAQGSVAPQVGSTVSFTSGTISTQAEVLWERSGRFGLRFEKPVEEADLLIDIGNPGTVRAKKMRNR